MRTSLTIILAFVFLAGCHDKVHEKRLADIKNPETLDRLIVGNCNDTVICKIRTHPDDRRYISRDFRSNSVIDNRYRWVTRKQFNDAGFIIGIRGTSDMPDDYGITYSYEDDLLVQKWHPTIERNWPFDSVSDDVEYTNIFKLDDNGRVKLAIDSSYSNVELFEYDTINRLASKTSFFWYSQELRIESMIVYKYDSLGSILEVEVRDSTMMMVDRYCFSKGYLDQIQHTNYVEECFCKSLMVVNDDRK